jgi:1,6-anhydro-N-acetylmuramate kinase
MDMPAYNLDAAGYGFLAVRFLMQMPITFPETTGVSSPMTGGVYHSSVRA